MTGFMSNAWGARGLFQRKDRQGRDRKRRARRRDASLTPLHLVLQQLEDRVLLTSQPDLVITAA
ncbi:MAG: hypothetical protein B7Z73_07235, partial [Planctomycetia bacterium 21-64-5]